MRKNKNKYFFSLLIFAFCFLIAKGQEDGDKGVQGIDIGGGVTRFSNYYQFSYYYFISDNYFIKPSLSFEVGKIGLTKYNEYSLLVSFEKCFLKLKDFVFINGGVAPAVQLQNSQNDVLEKSGAYFPLGVSLDVNMEIFVFSKVALFGSLNEIYSPNDRFGSFRYLLGGGLKMDLN
jgi:hypothetical protein